MNQNQVIAIFLVVLGVLIGSAAQLTDLFGAGTAKYIISVAGLLNSVLAGILGVLTGQGGSIKTVLAMPGIEKINVNGQANTALAVMAMDPAQDRIAPTPAAMQEVNQTAKG